MIQVLQNFLLQVSWDTVSRRADIIWSLLPPFTNAPTGELSQQLLSAPATVRPQESFFFLEAQVPRGCMCIFCGVTRLEQVLSKTQAPPGSFLTLHCHLSGSSQVSTFDFGLGILGF